MGNLFEWLRRYDKEIGLLMSILTLPTVAGFYGDLMGTWLNQHITEVLAVLLAVQGMAFTSVWLRLRQMQKWLDESQKQTFQAMNAYIAAMTAEPGGDVDGALAELAAVAGQLRAINPRIADGMVEILADHARAQQAAHTGQ